jgi:hypothetical protein
MRLSFIGCAPDGPPVSSPFAFAAPFYLQLGKQKSRVGGGQQSCLFLDRNSLVEKEM